MRLKNTGKQTFNIVKNQIDKDTDEIIGKKTIVVKPGETCEASFEEAKILLSNKRAELVDKTDTSSKAIESKNAK